MSIAYILIATLSFSLSANTAGLERVRRQCSWGKKLLSTFKFGSYSHSQTQNNKGSFCGTGGIKSNQSNWTNWIDLGRHDSKF